VATTLIQRTAIASVTILAALSAGCGDLVRQGRAPVQLVITSLTAASGAEPGEMGADLRSDVITNGGTINDLGEATISLILKDPGQPGLPASPSTLNQVTISRYRVVYGRNDGRNTPGADVPFSFDSAVTFTVPAGGSVTSGFQIVRHSAKLEAPLRALAFNGDIISTIATVTFFGRDQAGNEISVSGNIGIDFADFADPDSEEPDPE
jgi:hypothetical protein